jgi:uncharacterized protein YdcH (DUF465 family)
MELYPFGAIKSFKEDDAKFWALFDKMHHGLSHHFL